jgi:hypothetical protein
MTAFKYVQSNETVLNMLQNAEKNHKNVMHVTVSKWTQ